MDEKKNKFLYKLFDERKDRVEEICQMMGIPEATLYTYLTAR